MPSPTATTTTSSSSTSTSTENTTPDPSSSSSLESDLLTHLASTSALDDIHTNLLCYLQRMGWTEKIRTLSLELLRAGRCERFDEVVDAVMASAECRAHPAFDLSNRNPTTSTTTNGNGMGNTGNGNGKNGMVLSADAEAYLENVDVRIPAVVVEHGVRMVKGVLKDVVVFEDGTALDEGSDTHHHHHTNNGGGGQANGKHVTAGKRLDREDSGDSSSKGKNGDASPAKKTGKKTSLGKNAK